MAQCRALAMEPVPAAIIARQREATFLPIEGGFIKALRRALEAQPSGLFRAALCGVPLLSHPLNTPVGVFAHACRVFQIS